MPGALVTLGGLEPSISPTHPISFVARIAPGLVAILLSLLASGRRGLGDLFRPIKTWRVGIGWYAFALLFTLAVRLVGAGLDRLLGRAHEVVSPLIQVYGDKYLLMLPAVIISAIPGTLGEELGWRGFAQPRLQARHTALISSVVVGLIWGIWHIPNLLFFEEPSVLLIVDVLGLVPVAVLYAWLYNNTEGSLLLVWLMHLADQVVPNLLGSLPTLTDEILVWIVAVIVVLAFGPEHLSRQAESTR